jgi:hypothetical protein
MLYVFGFLLWLPDHLERNIKCQSELLLGVAALKVAHYQQILV